MFRVNYGNGQVSETYYNKRGAVAHLDSLRECRDFAFVQFRDNGEWFNCESNNAPRTR